MAKRQRPNDSANESPRQGKPSPGSQPAQGYDTPHEGAVRDEGTENLGGTWMPRGESRPDKLSKVSKNR